MFLDTVFLLKCIFHDKIHELIEILPTLRLARNRSFRIIFRALLLTEGSYIRLLVLSLGACFATLPSSRAILILHAVFASSSLALGSPWLTYRLEEKIFLVQLLAVRIPRTAGCSAYHLWFEGPVLSLNYCMQLFFYLSGLPMIILIKSLPMIIWRKSERAANEPSALSKTRSLEVSHIRIGFLQLSCSCIKSQLTESLLQLLSELLYTPLCLLPTNFEILL